MCNWWRLTFPSLNSFWFNFRCVFKIMFFTFSSLSTTLLVSIDCFKSSHFSVQKVCDLSSNCWQVKHLVTFATIYIRTNFLCRTSTHFLPDNSCHLTWQEWHIDCRTSITINLKTLFWIDQKFFSCNNQSNFDPFFEYKCDWPGITIYELTFGCSICFHEKECVE